MYALIISKHTSHSMLTISLKMSSYGQILALATYTVLCADTLEPYYKVLSLLGVVPLCNASES